VSSPTNVPQITDEQARAVARILWGARQRRVREAAEQAQAAADDRGREATDG
jgi:hypothetical protein